MKRTALLVALFMSASGAHAVTPAVLSASPTLDSGSSASATAYARPSSFGTGIIVTTGWFFKDTMFYSKGRGGLTVGAGKAFPVVRWLAVWTGVGALRVRGTMNTTAGGEDFETSFDGDAAWAEAGFVTPWLPFPVAFTVYRQRTNLDDAGRTGMMSGRRLAGTSNGWGAGAAVHLLFEFFLSNRPSPPRGWGIAFEYVGLMDFSGTTIRTGDAAGFTADHRGWKPFKGEAIRLGVEYEF